MHLSKAGKRKDRKKYAHKSPKIKCDREWNLSDLLGNAAKELGNPIKITGFVRYEIGEGIEQEQKNFADEVAAVIKQ